MREVTREFRELSIDDFLKPVSKLPEDHRKRLRSIRDRIRKTSNAFANATPSQKRVMIAQDVLFQISLRRFKPSSTYFENDKVFEATEMLDSTTQVQDLFKRMPSCHVCGIGSCFVATVDRVNELQIYDTTSLGSRDSQVEYLAKQGLFTGEHLGGIENAFEHGGWGRSPTDRLKKIMKRIIKLEGVFDSSAFDDLIQS